MEGLKEKYETFHGVIYEEGVIAYAVTAAARYISDRFLPDKAIDLVDEAGAYRETHPTDTEKQTVDKALITDILARICKVDVLAMKEEDNATLETLHERISAKIYGQEEAVCQVVEAVQMAKAGLLDENKPLASLLFVGPTGVGKTEVAKVLASELGIALQRFDMSEYTEKHTVAKLIGSPAGYVGYEDGGLLTDAIRKTPNCVLLLDEIEKAHPDVFNILLQVLDDGRLTDNKGRTVNFKNTIIIMTSNLGSAYIQSQFEKINDENREVVIEETKKEVMSMLKKTIRPEFLNRIDETIMFLPLNREEIEQIVMLQINGIKNMLAGNGITLEMTDEAVRFIASTGYDPEFGARPVKRAIQRYLLNDLSKNYCHRK